MRLKRGSGEDVVTEESGENNYYCRDVETENLDDMVTLADRLKNEREATVPVEQTE